MSQNKEIKFAFVVDERSAQQAKRVIKELIDSADKLAKTLAGVTLGGSGGGVLAGGVGSNPSRATVAGRMAAPAPGPNGQQKGLAQVFLDNANGLKGLANVSRDSMRVMSDGIKRAVDEQKRSIGELDATLARLAKRYDDLKGREKSLTNAGMSPDAARSYMDQKRSSLESETVGTVAARDERMKSLSKLDDQRRKIAMAMDPSMAEDEAAAAGGKGGGGGMFGGMASRFGRYLPPGMAGQVGRFGGSAAIAMGAKALYNTAWDQNWNQPMAYQQAASARGQLWGDAAVATHFGDRSYMDASNRIMADGSKRKEFEKISQQTGSARWENFKFSHLLNWGEGLRAQSDPAVQQTIQGRLRGYQDMERQQDPLRDVYMNQLYTQSGARLGLMRQTGIGGGIAKERGHGYQKGQYVSFFDRFMQGTREMGYSDEEVAGVMAGVEGQGTRAAGRALRYNALGAQGAGIRGGADILGQMSEGGIGTASRFMDQLLSTTGDVSALGRVGQSAAGMVQAGGFGGSGLGLLDVLSMGLTGGAGDALTSRQNIQGLQQLQHGLIQGGQDPYQQARNTQLSFKRFGEKGMYAAQYAGTQMTAEELAGLRRGELSPNLQNLGFGTGDISGLMELQADKTGSRLDRLVKDPRAAGSPLMKDLGGLQEAISDGGSAQGWFQGLDKKEREKALSSIATFYQVSGQAQDYGSAMGMARTEFGMFDEAGARVGKRGAAGRGSVEADQMKLNAESAKKFTEFIETEGKKLLAEGDRMRDARDAWVKITEDMSRTGQDFVTNLAAISATTSAIAIGRVSKENASSYLQAQKDLQLAQTAASKAVGGGGANKVSAQKAVQAAEARVRGLERR